MSRKLLITGGGGRLASLLRPLLAQTTDWQIHGQSRRAADAENWHQLDPLTDSRGFARLCDGCDAVLHLAGVTPATRHGDSTANVDLARVVAQATAQVPLVLAMSSVAVYGPSGRPLREGGATAPNTAYGRSKLAMEEVILEQSNGPLITCLRLGNVVGADALMQGQPCPTELHAFPNGRTPERSYISPVTLARVLMQLIDRGLTRGTLPPVINVAAPEPVEMAALMRAAGLPWTPIPAPAGLDNRVVVSTLLLERLVDLPVFEACPAFLTAHFREQLRKGADDLATAAL